MHVDGAKTCRVCKIPQPLDQFYKDRSRVDGLTGRCVDCTKQAVSSWRASDPGRAYERGRSASRRYSRGAGLVRKYGITAEDRAEILERQGHRCAICGVLEEESRGRNPGRLCVDHDHETGRVRGLLCGPCNAALGRFGSVTLLVRAIRYLIG